jgi:hypothetical protein
MPITGGLNDLLIIKFAGNNPAGLPDEAECIIDTPEFFKTFIFHIYFKNTFQIVGENFPVCSVKMKIVLKTGLQGNILFSDTCFAENPVKISF